MPVRSREFIQPNERFSVTDIRLSQANLEVQPKTIFYITFEKKLRISKIFDAYYYTEYTIKMV